MIVRSVRHRGLRLLIENDNPRFLRRDLADRVRKMMTALILAERLDEFIAGAPPGGVSTGFQGVAGTSGAFRYPAIGGSRSKKRMATSTA